MKPNTAQLPSYDDYDIIKVCGQGVYGKVNKAVHRKSGNIVALKMLKGDLKNEQGIQVIYYREFRILQKLNHSNIVKLIDVFADSREDDKVKPFDIYFAFEYMDHDLTGLLQSKFKFSEPIIKSFVKQMLEGLKYLHSLNVIHRDIKSANMLVSRKGVVKIADFGLARQIHDVEHKSKKLTSNVVTRWYKCPELLMGMSYNYAVDVFGIGIICGELYKRKPLLPGLNDQDQLQKIFDFVGDPVSIKWKPVTVFSFTPGRTPIGILKFAEENNIDKGCIDFMKKILHINPSVRLTASEAIDHPWFACSPFPSEPGRIEIKGEHHEISQTATNNYGPTKNHKIVQPTSIQDRRYQGNQRGNTRANRYNTRGRGRGRPY